MCSQHASILGVVYRKQLSTELLSVQWVIFSEKIKLPVYQPFGNF